VIDHVWTDFPTCANPLWPGLIGRRRSCGEDAERLGARLVDLGWRRWSGRSRRGRRALSRWRIGCWRRPRWTGDRPGRPRVIRDWSRRRDLPGAGEVAIGGLTRELGSRYPHIRAAGPVPDHPADVRAGRRVQRGRRQQPMRQRESALRPRRDRPDHGATPRSTAAHQSFGVPAGRIAGSPISQAQGVRAGRNRSRHGRSPLPRTPGGRTSPRPPRPRCPPTAPRGPPASGRFRFLVTGFAQQRV